MAFISLQLAAERANLTTQAVWKNCKKWAEEGLARITPAGWEVSELADKRFIRCRRPELDPNDLLSATEKDRQVYYDRLKILKLWEHFVKSQMELRLSRSEATDLFVRRYRAENPDSNISRASLYRWDKANIQQGPKGLLPKYSTTESKISEEAIAFFRYKYLDPRKPSVKKCFDEVAFVADQSGWTWFNRLRSCQRWVTAAFPERSPEVILGRLGEKAYESLAAPYIKRDPEQWEANQCWYGDHHQFDLFVWHRNQFVRPWLTAWQDARTKLITGFSIETDPNQVTIFSAFRAGCLGEFGPPEFCYIDNGKDYGAYTFHGTTKRQRQTGKKLIDEGQAMGLFAAMGIETHFAIPYNAKAKAIERTFRTFKEQFDKNYKTYCGRSPEDRPENQPELLKEAREQLLAGKQPEGYPTLEELRTQFRRYLDEVYHIQVHTGDGMNGMSPLEAMRTLLVSKRLANEGVLKLMLQIRQTPTRVGKGGGVESNHYIYGIGHPVLMPLQGQLVQVGYDPNDLREVTIFDLKGRLICTAENSEAAGKIADDVGVGVRDQRRYKRNLRNADDARRFAHLDVPDLAHRAMVQRLKDRHGQIPAAANPDTYKPIQTDLEARLMQKIRPLKQAVGDDIQLDDFIKGRSGGLTDGNAGEEDMNTELDQRLRLHSEGSLTDDDE